MLRATDPWHIGEIERVIQGSGSPLGAQFVLADPGDLCLTGVQCGNAGTVTGVNADAFHLGDDFGSAP